MTLLFTKHKGLEGKFITWGLGEPCTHVAMLFYESIVFHSTLKGVGVISLDRFKENNDIIYFKKVDVDYENELFLNSLVEYSGKSYDIKSYLYFGFRAFLKKFFFIPFPKHNALNDKSADLCTELVGEVLKIKEIDLSITTPTALYNYLMAKLGG